MRGPSRFARATLFNAPATFQARATLFDAPATFQARATRA